MKTFNPVRVAGEGVLARWAVADGAPVEAGQLLGWVRPAAPGAA
jgi:biotin carboxyl carrier protein